MTGPGRFAEPPPGVVAVPTLRTSAGAPVSAVVTLTNNAPEPRILVVTPMGLDAEWLPLPARTRPVLPQQSVEVELTISPALGALPARYPMTIAVQALDPVTEAATAQTVLADLVVILDAPGQVAVAVNPVDSTGVFSSHLDVVLTNSSALPADVDLETRTPNTARIRLRSAQIRVGAGETVRVPGRVSPRHARLFGDRVRHAFTITAHTAGAPRSAEGSFTARALLGPTATKAAALIVVAAAWLALAVVFVPKVADKLTSHKASTSTQSKSPGNGAGGNGGSGGNGGNGGSGGNGGGGSGGSGGAAAAAKQVRLNGTISGIAPNGVSVDVTPTTFNDALGQGAQPVGVATQAWQPLGKIDAASLPAPVSADQGPVQVFSSTDGSWAVPPLPNRGYYLLTFAKTGFQTVRYVVDGSAASSAQPLTVQMNPGQGSLNGTVRGPGGALGGATITITDGHTTTTTTTNSRGGNVGGWSVQGLSTPANYLVTATYDGLSTESRLVSLGPAGSAAVTLTLKTGVVSLRGRITGPNDLGALVGIGGATITATSDTATRTVTALTADGVAGNYILPDLPAGIYTVTIAAAGYVSQTSKLTLPVGASSRSLSAQLTPATAIVFGTVSGLVGGKPVGQAGAGLVLTGPNNTYKTTTTSQTTDTTAGSFTLNGVAPGTYVLTIEMFGFQSDTVTVTATAGGRTEVDRTLQLLIGGVLPATAQVRGQAVDAHTGTAVVAPPGSDFGADCDGKPLTTFELTATVVDTNTSGTSTTYCTNFLPTEQYTLPDPARNPDAGLLPGLHTVVISAVGYEDTEVQVSVPLAGVVTAPVAQLPAAPRLIGLVTSASGVPAHPTCLFAVTSSVAPLPQCGATAPGCPPAAAGVSCTEPTGTGNAVGNYTLIVPRHGSYRVYAANADTDYQTAAGNLAVGVQTITLGLGQILPYDFRLHRSGHVTVVLQIPGADGNLQTLTDNGATVTVIGPLGSGVSCAATTPVVTTQTINDGTGQLTVTGLNGSYAIKATYTASGSQLTRSGCVTDTVGLDQSDTVLLPLTNPVSLVGRVGYFIDGGTSSAIPDATVVVTGVYGYNGTQALRRTWTMTTDANGCFAIRSSDPPPAATECPGLAAEEVDDTFGNSTQASPVGHFASNGALLSLVVSATITHNGFTTLNVPQQAESAPVNEFTMQALPVAFTSSGNTNTLLASPASAGAPLGALVSVVRASDNTSGGITVSLSQDATVPNAADLSWHDPALAGTSPGYVQPGTYALTASLAGYQPATATLRCVALPTPGCTLDLFELHKNVEIDIAAVDSGGNPVNGAQFTLYDGAAVDTRTPMNPVTPAGNLATFPGLLPGHTGYQVAIRAAGYRFTVPPGTSGAALNYTLTCDTGTSGTDSSPPPAAIADGDTITCVAHLQRLGSITGVVTGINALASSVPATLAGGGSPVTSPVGGATVAAQLCTATATGTDPVFGTTVTYCTAVSGPTFTASSGASTSATPGSFTITGSLSQEGLAAGSYLVTVPSAPGYCQPSTAVHGTCPVTMPATVGSGANPPAPLPGFVVTIPDAAAAGDDLTTATVTPQLFEQPAVAVFKATFQQGSKTPAATGLTMTTGADSTLASPQTAVESPAGTYTFAQILPGTYTFTASSDTFALTSHQQTITVGGGPYPFTISKTNNEIKGTISGVQNAATTATGLPGATVIVVLASDGCGGTPVTGTDGSALSATTDANGTYDFTNVPNTTGKNKYQVCASHYGYLTAFGSAFTVSGSASSTQSLTLTRVSQNVTITLSAALSGDDISAITAASLVSSTASGVPSTGTRALTVTPVPGHKDTVTLTGTQVPYGCYSLTVALPSGHYGTIGNPTSVVPASDSQLACASNEMELLGTASDNKGNPIATGTATADWTLTEYQLTLSTTATAISPDPVPGVAVSVVQGTSTTPFFTTTLTGLTSGTAGTTVIWVGGGSYQATASVPGDTNGQWDTSAGTVTKTLSSTATAATAALKLTDTGGGLDVTVVGASSSDNASVSIACTSADTPAPGCTTAQSKTDSGSGTTFSGLPVSDSSGPLSWTVTATLHGYTVTQAVTLTGGRPLKLTMPSASTTPTYFAATLTVTVTGATTGNVIAVEVKCTDSTACGSYDQTANDTGSGATFKNLVPGSYLVTATDPRTKSVSEGVTLSSGQVLTLPLPSSSSTPTAFPPTPPPSSSTSP